MRRCPRKGNVFYAVEVAEIRKKRENTGTEMVLCLEGMQIQNLRLSVRMS